VLRSTQPTKGFVTMMQVVQAERFLGRRLRFAATVRTEAVTGWSGLWMRVDGADAQHPLAFDNMQTRPLTGTLPCTRVSVVLDVAPDAKQVALGVLLDGEGLVEMSGVAIEPVEPTVPSTALKVATRPDTEDAPLGRVNQVWFSDRIVHAGVGSTWVLHRRSVREWSDDTGDDTASLSGDEVAVKLGRNRGTFKVRAEGDVTIITGTWGAVPSYPVELRVSHQRVDLTWGFYERHLVRDDSSQVLPACAQFTERAEQGTPSDFLEVCGAALEPGGAPVQRTIALLLNGFRRERMTIPSNRTAPRPGTPPQGPGPRTISPPH